MLKRPPPRSKYRAELREQRLHSRPVPNTTNSFCTFGMTFGRRFTCWLFCRFFSDHGRECHAPRTHARECSIPTFPNLSSNDKSSAAKQGAHSLGILPRAFGLLARATAHPYLNRNRLMSRAAVWCRAPARPKIRESSRHWPSPLTHAKMLRGSRKACC